MKSLFVVVVVIGASFGCASKPKPSPGRELAREQYIDSSALYMRLVEQRREAAKKTINAAAWSKMQSNVQEAREVMDSARRRFDHFDDCTDTYRKTNDRRMSDLTVQELSDVDTCKTLELYPPPVK